MSKNSKTIDIISSERRSSDLRALSGLLPPLVKKILGKKALVETDLLAEWADIVGDDLAAYTRPQRLVFKRGERSGGVLRIEVPSGAFALELQHREQYVLARVNAYFGYPAAGRISIVQNADFSLPADDVGKTQKMLVTAEEESYIRELSEGIQNKNLRSRLQSLGRWVVSSNKDEKQDEFEPNH